MGIRSRTATLVVAGITLLVPMATTSCGKGDQKGAESAGKPAQAAAPLPPALSSFVAEITVPAPPPPAKAKSQILLPVKVRNGGTQAWPSKGGPEGANGVYLAYHWFRPDGSTAVFDGKRTFFAADVPPSSEAVVEAAVTAPDEPGSYVLELDLVQERVTWFKERGSKTARLDVKIE